MANKYDPLGHYLQSQGTAELHLTFDEIENLVGPLPKEASKPQFWANARAHHQTRRSQWMNAGYDAHLEPAENSVRFVLAESPSDAAESNQSGELWPESELRACVSAYRTLIDGQRNGTEINKSKLRSEVLANELNRRSDSAYEFRMRNISHVMQELGLPVVVGYRPAANIGSRREVLIKIIREIWEPEDFQQPRQRKAKNVQEHTFGPLEAKPGTVFLTKVWGFDTPVGPLQFSSDGWRKNALEKLKPGDMVITVGTSGHDTSPELQGRILSMVQPTSEPVMSLDFALMKRPGSYNEGKYKWPVALMIERAWSLVDRPLLSELVDRKFQMDSAQGIVPLTDEEAERILCLNFKKEKILQSSASAQARLDKRQGKSTRTAPPPTTSRTGIMHMRRAPAHTYAMRIDSARLTAFKIGWAFNFKARARQFNHHSMPELGGLRYCPILYHLWDSAKDAYLFEQELLRHLDEHRNYTNNEVITGVSENELSDIWNMMIGRKLSD